jgi:hypothetical protein
MADDILRFAKSTFGAWAASRAKAVASFYKREIPKLKKEYKDGLLHKRWGKGADDYYRDRLRSNNDSIEKYQRVGEAALAAGASGKGIKPPAKVVKDFPVDLSDLPASYPVEKMTQVTASIPVTLVFTGKPYESGKSTGAWWVYHPVTSRGLTIVFHGTHSCPDSAADFQARIDELDESVQHELRHMVQSLLGDALGKPSKDMTVGAPHRNLAPESNKDDYYLNPIEYHTWMGQAKAQFLSEVSFRPEYLTKSLKGQPVEIEPTRAEFDRFVGNPKPIKSGVFRSGMATHPFFEVLWRRDQSRWRRAVSELWKQVSPILKG